MGPPAPALRQHLPHFRARQHLHSVSTDTRRLRRLSHMSVTWARPANGRPREPGSAQSIPSIQWITPRPPTPAPTTERPPSSIRGPWTLDKAGCGRAEGQTWSETNHIRLAEICMLAVKMHHPTLRIKMSNFTRRITDGVGGQGSDTPFSSQQEDMQGCEMEDRTMESPGFNLDSGSSQLCHQSQRAA